MDIPDYIAAVEEGFRASANGGTISPQPMHIPVEGGGFHAKGALLRGSHPYVAVKINGNFPANPACHGLPTIQGAILLCDAADGRLLAVMDSIEITLQRTAAASALAARYLARPASRVATICGCGEQARAQLTALRRIVPLCEIRAWDIDPAKASAFARETAQRFSIEVRPVEDLHAATIASDVIVTCTPARKPFLKRADVRAGTFVAAVGADSHDKSEIAPDLMADATVVADVLEQCLVMGDSHHAIRAGTLRADDIYAELGELVAGTKCGRTRDDEIIIFDSTGTAIQDVATAVCVYARATAEHVGTLLPLGTPPGCRTPATSRTSVDQRLSMQRRRT